MANDTKKYSYISVESDDDEDVIYVSERGVEDHHDQRGFERGSYDSHFDDDPFKETSSQPRRAQHQKPTSTSAFDSSFDSDDLNGEVPHERMKYGIIFALVALIIAFIIYFIAWGV